MKKINLICILFFGIILAGCDKKEADVVEPVIVEETENNFTEQIINDGEEIWVLCPTRSQKVGTTYTFIDGDVKYITTSQKYGPALYEGIKYPNITAQISVKARTKVNPTEYDILDIRFYDDGTELRSIKTIDALWDYYRETYEISKPGDKFHGAYTLINIKKDKTLNGEIYLALTFTDDKTGLELVCRDFNKQDIMTMNESYYGKTFEIEYRVDEGLHYNENRTDILYTLISKVGI